jgi:hypothetical protein
LKLSALSESTVAYLNCPSCGTKAPMQVEKHTARCPDCMVSFAVDVNSASHSDVGLEPPYIQFSARYGGPFADKLSATTAARPLRMGEQSKP